MGQVNQFCDAPTPQGVVNEPRAFGVEELFFSTTDRRGVIRHGNAVFTRVSGYTPDQMFGKPHRLVRHPDMPRVVFRLLWDTLERGETIAAYVKNRAQGGRYYWVLAVAMPCDGGYLSVRLKPSSGLLPRIEALYGRLRSIEHQIESTPSRRDEAIAAAGDALNTALSGMGFRSYNTFMRHALAEESAARRAAIEGSGAAQEQAQDPRLPAEVDRAIASLNDELEAFQRLSNGLGRTAGEVLEQAQAIRILGLNASVAVEQMGRRAGALRVVSRSLGTLAGEIQTTIGTLSEGLSAAGEGLDRLRFELFATRLQSEVNRLFCVERDATGGDPLADQSVATLVAQLRLRVAGVFDQLTHTLKLFDQLEGSHAQLLRQNRSLRYTRMTGHKELASCGGTGAFAVVLESAGRHADHLESACTFIAESLQEFARRAEGLHGRQVGLERQLDRLASWSDRQTRPPGPEPRQAT